MDKKMAGVACVVAVCFALTACGSSRVDTPGDGSLDSQSAAQVNGSGKGQPPHEETKPWVEDDFLLYNAETGEAMYRALDMRMTELNEKSGIELQLRGGIQIGSTAEELLETYDLTGFYSSATSIGNTVVNRSETLQASINAFNAEYPTAEDKLRNTDAAMEDRLGLFFSNYFYADADGNILNCRVKENGNQDDYEETKGFDRYYIHFQVDRGVVSEISIERKHALETDQAIIDSLYKISEDKLRELGETGEIKSFILEKPRDLDVDGNADAQYRCGYMYASRYVEIMYFPDSEDGAWRISSISEHDDHMHYYYYPGLDAINALQIQGLGGKLYDYVTDQPILAASSDEGERGFAEAMKKGGFVSVDISDSRLYAVRLDVLSADYVDADELSREVLLKCAQLFSDTLGLDEIPCELIGIQLYVDGESIGSMTIFTSASTGLIGTCKPVILDTAYADMFETTYNTYFTEMDFQNLSVD